MHANICLTTTDSAQNLPPPPPAVQVVIRAPAENRASRPAAPVSQVNVEKKPQKEEKRVSYYDSNMTEKIQGSTIIPLRTKKPQTMKKHNEDKRMPLKQPNLNTTAKFSLASQQQYLSQ